MQFFVKVKQRLKWFNSQLLVERIKYFYFKSSEEPRKMFNLYWVFARSMYVIIFWIAILFSINLLKCLNLVIFINAELSIKNIYDFNRVKITGTFWMVMSNIFVDMFNRHDRFIRCITNTDVFNILKWVMPASRAFSLRYLVQNVEWEWIGSRSNPHKM